MQSRYDIISWESGEICIKVSSPVELKVISYIFLSLVKTTLLLEYWHMKDLVYPLFVPNSGNFLVVIIDVSDLYLIRVPISVKAIA